MTINSEILEVVKNLPGVTSGQIVEFMPHVNKQTVYANLHSMYLRGELSRDLDDAAKDGRGRPPYKWSISATGKPPMVRKVKPSEVQRFNDCVVTTRPAVPPADLYGELEELRRWKADAIARYPDLAVDPLVLKARQMVAEEIGDTDAAMRDAVLAGQRDGALPMRVALKLLEGTL